MNSYQLKFFALNLKEKFLKIIKEPIFLKLYFNEYFKDNFLYSKKFEFILSYPKSGRTWVYEILNLYSHKKNFENLKYNKKMIKFNNKIIKFIHDCSDANPYPIKKTKLELKTKNLNQKKKIILIRDPREVIISMWYQMKFREKTYKKSINEMIDDEYFGIEKIILFYNFINDNLLNNSKIITYLDLKNNTFKEIKKILLFFDIEINEKLLKASINECSFKNLQNKEIKESKKKDPRSMKFRKGLTGNFYDNLNHKDLLKINKIIKIKLNSNFKKILNLENV